MGRGGLVSRRVWECQALVFRGNAPLVHGAAIVIEIVDHD